MSFLKYSMSILISCVEIYVYIINNQNQKEAQIRQKISKEQLQQPNSNI